MAIEKFNKAPIMSLQTGRPLGFIAEPIINPNTLRVVAFFVNGPSLDFHPAVLFTEDIREFGPMGAIVDSVDNIMPTEGMVRLNEVISYNFKLDNIKVVDKSGRSLGRVSDYFVDGLKLDIYRINVKPNFFQSLKTSELVIYRSQIVEVESDKIIVESPIIKQEKPVKDVINGAQNILNPEFDNPFRKPRSASPDRQL